MNLNWRIRTVESEQGTVLSERTKKGASANLYNTWARFGERDRGVECTVQGLAVADRSVCTCKSDIRVVAHSLI